LSYREKREMHKAVCADCGQECEVPFKPKNPKKKRGNAGDITTWLENVRIGNIHLLSKCAI